MGSFSIFSHKLIIVQGEAKLDVTPEIEVFNMLFERCHTNKRAMAL